MHTKEKKSFFLNFKIPQIKQAIFLVTETSKEKPMSQYHKPCQSVVLNFPNAVSP